MTEKSGHTYQAPKGPSTVERLTAELAEIKAVADAANALITFVDGPQTSPKTRAQGRAEREDTLRKALKVWKAKS